MAKEEENQNQDKEQNSEKKNKKSNRLKYDSIFKGRKSYKEEELHEDHEDFMMPRYDDIEYDPASISAFESANNTEYERIKDLKKDIYQTILNHTNINIKTTRRKPSKEDFNKYYNILISYIDMSKYSYGEVFIELSYYFSDNVYNMFKLLDHKYGGEIVNELKEKYNISEIDNINFI